MLPAMQRGVVILALAGCGFRGAAAPDAQVGDAIVDDAAADAATDGAASAFCNPIDGLVACYEFEGEVQDLSGHGHDATTANVVFVPGGVFGSAMLFAATSAANVPASTAFDVADITIEAWVKPTTLPLGGKQ